MLPPNFISRSTEEIVNEKLYFDSAGYLYRSMSWLDYFEKNKQFTALLYACIEARYGIEYLIFEEIVISTGANLSREDYEKCLKDSTKLHKKLKRITPDYKLLQQFSMILVSLEPRLPKIIQWDPSELMKSWGKISKYLHWCGSRNNTTELASWKDDTFKSVKREITPIWLKISSGQSGIMHPNDMQPEIRELWFKYKDGEVDKEGIKIRMNILKPILESKYA